MTKQTQIRIRRDGVETAVMPWRLVAGWLINSTAHNDSDVEALAMLGLRGVAVVGDVTLEVCCD